MNHIINHESELFDIARIEAVSSQKQFFEAHLSVEIRETDLLKCIEEVLGVKISTCDISKKTNFSYDDENKFYPLTEMILKFPFGNNYYNFFCYMSYVIDDEKNKDAIVCLCGEIKFFGNLNNEDKIKKLFAEILKYDYTEDDGNKFFVVALDGRGGLGLKKEKIVNQELDLESNNGKDFLKVYDKIYMRLKNHKSDLVLLY